ncbi:hypothetical protein AB0F81_19360 [Actinoplanes sp. NPDC024001]|uniref:hypothetical protein n=1 Tax=Actinoplanes sp. NPDC024001 TaxID=3154598 RepID=UPI0033D2C901
MPRHQPRPDRARVFAVTAGALVVLLIGIGSILRSGGGFQWHYALWAFLALFVAGGALIGGSREPRPYDPPPRRWRVHPARVWAVTGALIAFGLMGYVAVDLARSGSAGFVVCWVPFGVAIVGARVWHTFRKTR